MRFSIDVKSATLVTGAFVLLIGVAGRARADYLNGSMWYENSDQNYSVAQAKADSLNYPLGATFHSTLLSGTVYSANDYNSLSQFLGADAPTLVGTNQAIRSWYADITGVFETTAVQAGNTTFTLGSDDGSLLYVDGNLVVSDDGTHPTQSTGGSINLGAGQHTIEIQYFNHDFGFGQDYLSATGLYANGDRVNAANPAPPAPAPEPAGITLLGIGCTGLLGYAGLRRRKDRKAACAG